MPMLKLLNKGSTYVTIGWDAILKSAFVGQLQGYKILYNKVGGNVVTLDLPVRYYLFIQS